MRSMSNPNKRKGSGMEDRVVREAKKRELDARKQPGSGIYANYPSDVVVEQILVEAKTGYSRVNVAGEKIFSLNMTWLSKVEKEAQTHGFDNHALAFRPTGTTKCYAVIDLNFFLDLLVKGKTNV